MSATSARLATAHSDSTHTTAKKQTLTIELTTPIDDRRPVYVVGNFNNWTPEQSCFKMTRVASGRFMLVFPSDVPLPHRLEYKYVRGGWENQELDSFGNAVKNRVLENPQGFVRDFVARWSNYGLTFTPSFLPKIQVVSPAFFSPELKKNRRVVALLPYNYDKETQKRYPVLYLQDAQNLFDDKAPYGNWGIDKKLAVLAERGMGDVIIIAVDHAGENRINEFLPPTKDHQLGHSEGRKYVKFLSKTLKPYIDSQFRTLTDRLHTGIGGSSMGGLISIYAGLIYPETFGRLMIFSPSLWAVQNAPFAAIRFFKPVPTRIYAYAGDKEGSTVVPNVKNFQKAIQSQGFDDTKIGFKLVVDPNGSHDEKRWGEEFPKAVEWLFFN
ncbi:MAG: alpha/beta hydrolase-fold protein [Saprospiraceae bacterium]|nr:alpha/beta hydrolase-fold protein [Saprospiraceae bacterium]